MDRGKITQLKVSLPYIDAVTNVLPASGGADAETLEELKERGPIMLKHRDRAVTAGDFEWLMKEAPGDIAMSKCIPNKERFPDGPVRVIIVPHLDDPRPFPDEILLKKVEKYIYERSFAPLISSGKLRVQVEGPGYIEVSVEAEIVPQSIGQASKVEEKAIANLETFFHPLKGGPENKGWPFGRDVHRAEVMTVLQNTEGVDFVKSLQLHAPGQHDPARIYLQPEYLVYSGTHTINMMLAE